LYLLFPIKFSGKQMFIRASPVELPPEKSIASVRPEID
jgi:hypothetical protein